MQAPCLPDDPLQREDLPPLIVGPMLDLYRTHLKQIALIDEDFPSLSGIKITQCVCIGLGNITRHFSHLEFGDHVACLGKRNDSLLQLAALSIFLELLAKSHPVENVYFQDPSFTDYEKSFLSGLGYKVVDDPEAFNLVNSTTFLFAPVVDDVVWAKALEHASPALYIGKCVDLTLTEVSYIELGYGFEERETMLKTLPRFRKETVALEIPFCKKYCMGSSGSARMLLPKGNASNGSEEEERQ